MTLETESYHYSAHTYLDEWLWIDRDARRVLGYEEGKETDREIGRLKLLEVATYYRVIRNFPGEEPLSRLGTVWDEVAKVEKPQSAEEAKRVVNQLAISIRPDHRLHSAASKFLWMRFGDPIVICDSVAWAWMRRQQNGLRDSSSWDDFYDRWQEEFAKREGKIRSACAELALMRKFMQPNVVTESEFTEAIRSNWFTRRVFDHFMLNAPVKVA